MQLANTINKAEYIMQKMPQAECPVVHRFGDGIYIREVTMPTGTLAIGHIQKYPQNNFLLSGKVALLTDDGIKILEAPMFFVGEAGRKIGFVLETVVWQNIWATNETDVEKLENHYLEKSSSSELNENELNKIDYLSRQSDRLDYEDVVLASPFTHDQIKEQVENKDDLIDMPQEWSGLTVVRSSNIQGKGVFSTCPMEKGVEVGPARIDGKRTPLGRFTNHARKPNAKPVMRENGDVYLVSSRFIDGCLGGSVGEEITVDYREMLKLSGIEL